MTRKHPYTQIGVRRLKCARCGAKAEHQWKACADGCWRPLCLGCDVALNELVLRWMGDPKWKAKIKKYKARS